MSFITRLVKGAALTWAELDANFTQLTSKFGSSLVGFLQAGAGAGPRTLQAKEREIVSITDFYANGVDGAMVDPTGITDSTAGIQAALNSGATTVVLNDGTYKITTYLLVPAGVRFKGQSRGAILSVANNIPNYATWGTAHQGQTVLLNGNGAECIGITINGNAYVAGGVAAWVYDTNRIEDNYIYNSTGSTHGILATGNYTGTSCTNLIIRGNYLKWCGANGMELWQITNGLVCDNAVRVMGAGGIFLADCISVEVCGNRVSDCADVGIDIEGGLFCSVHSNNVSSCCNGELTYFSNGTGSGRGPVNNSFQGNIVTRTTTYLATSSETPTATSTTYGGITIASVTAGENNIVFSGNSVFADTRLALMTNALGAAFCGVTIKDNQFNSNAQIFLVSQAYGVVIQGNTFNGANGSEAYQNTVKNCSAAIFDGNTITYVNAKTTNEALYYYTDAALAVGTVFSNNRFFNCNQYAFKHDPFTSGTPALLTGNNFAAGAVDGYQANGGVNSTANGYPVFKNQKLYLQITASLDLSAVTALKGPCVGYGKLMVTGGGAQGASYDFVYSSAGPTVVSRDGTGSASGIPTSTTRYAAFSGTTITITAPATAYGNIDLDVDSWTA